VKFTAVLWETQSMGAWVFVSLPQDLSDEIRAEPRPPKPGFGSIRVSVTVGPVTWATSIFPEKNDGPYVLPVKKAVRQASGVDVGDEIAVTLELLE